MPPLPLICATLCLKIIAPSFVSSIVVLGVSQFLINDVSHPQIRVLEILLDSRIDALVRAMGPASPPSTRPDGTQNPNVVTEPQMTLDDINVIFCAVAVEVGGRFVYRERKAEENEIKIKCSHRHLCFATHRRRGKSAGCGEPPALDDTAGYAALPPSTRPEAERAPAELPISSGGG